MTPFGALSPRGDDGSRASPVTPRRMRALQLPREACRAQLARAPHPVSGHCCARARVGRALGYISLASAALKPKASAPSAYGDTLAFRPQQARGGPVLGRSHLGVSGRGERGAVSSRVPLDARRSSALLLARSRRPMSAGEATCSCCNAVFSATARRPALTFAFPCISVAQSYGYSRSDVGSQQSWE